MSITTYFFSMSAVLIGCTLLFLKVLFKKTDEIEAMRDEMEEFRHEIRGYLLDIPKDVKEAIDARLIELNVDLTPASHRKTASQKKEAASRRKIVKIH